MALPVNRERKMVPKQHDCLDFEYDTLEAVLEQVKRLIEHHGKDATIQSHSDRYGNSDKEYMYVYTMLPETDSEMAVRIAYEEKWAKEDEAREKAEFKRLQEKFGEK